MKIIVKRVHSDKNSTISKVYIDGIYECDAVEDEFREIKVKGETRIPAGSYKIKVRLFGGFHQKFSKHKDISAIHEGMLEVTNVPGFTDILIHTGNSEKDSMGCLILGKADYDKNTGKPKSMWVGQSVVTYMAFYKKVISAAKSGLLEIEYVDEDRS